MQSISLERMNEFSKETIKPQASSKASGPCPTARFFYAEESRERSLE
jgi:hypothetical protein